MASCRLLRTMRTEQLLRLSVNSNSVRSTVTNNTKSIQQTVIDLVPIKPNPRITLFPYSNIQENLTIKCYSTNDKNWNYDLYWKVMFNSCNNMVNYIVDFVMALFILLLFWWIKKNILHLFFYFFQLWLNMW